MASVEILPEGGTPAPAAQEQPVRRPTNERTVTSADGKTLTYRPLRTLERMDLNAIAGAQNAVNIAWMADASLAFSVVAINGAREPKPGTMLELRHLIQRIGDDGMEAIAMDVQASAMGSTAPDEAKAQAGE